MKRSNDGRLQPVSNATDYSNKSKSVSNPSVGGSNPSAVDSVTLSNQKKTNGSQTICSESKNF